MYGNGNSVNRVGQPGNRQPASLCGEFAHYCIVDSNCLTVKLAKGFTYLFPHGTQIIAVFCLLCTSVSDGQYH